MTLISSTSSKGMVAPITIRKKKLIVMILHYNIMKTKVKINVNFCKNSTTISSSWLTYLGMASVTRSRHDWLMLGP